MNRVLQHFSSAQETIESQSESVFSHHDTGMHQRSRISFGLEVIPDAVAGYECDHLMSLEWPSDSEAEFKADIKDDNDYKQNGKYNEKDNETNEDEASPHKDFSNYMRLTKYGSKRKFRKSGTGWLSVKLVIRQKLILATCPRQNE